MKIFIVAFVILHLSICSSAQVEDIKAMVDSLPFMYSDTLNCNAALYWRIVAKGKAAIPFLIDKLDDTTATYIFHKCKGARLNVGEVSYFALQEIADFPAFAITHVQFDIDGENGCLNFFDYLFNNDNKKRYRELVRQWYKENKGRFRVEKIPVEKRTECEKKFGIGTFLMWKERD